jgi:hypothetical protein
MNLGESVHIQRLKNGYLDDWLMSWPNVESAARMYECKKIWSVALDGPYEINVEAVSVPSG